MNCCYSEHLGHLPEIVEEGRDKLAMVQMEGERGKIRLSLGLNRILIKPFMYL